MKNCQLLLLLCLSSLNNKTNTEKMNNCAGGGAALRDLALGPLLIPGSAPWSEIRTNYGAADDLPELHRKESEQQRAMYHITVTILGGRSVFKVQTLIMLRRALFLKNGYTVSWVGNSSIIKGQVCVLQVSPLHTGHIVIR